MILMHKSLKRSDDIMRSLRRLFEVNLKTIDGVLECFNNDIGEGYIIKMYESYDSNNDLAVWMFEDVKNKIIKIAYSNLENIDKYNNWIDAEKVNIKEYLVKTEIKREIIQDIFDNVKDYYRLNEEIEYERGFSI